MFTFSFFFKTVCLALVITSVVHLQIIIFLLLSPEKSHHASFYSFRPSVNLFFFLLKKKKRNPRKQTFPNMAFSPICPCFQQICGHEGAHLHSSYHPISCFETGSWSTYYSRFEPFSIRFIWVFSRASWTVTDRRPQRWHRRATPDSEKGSDTQRELFSASVWLSFGKPAR